MSYQVALQRIRFLSDFTVAGIWLYQGLVPKILGPHVDELAMSAAFGLPQNLQAPISYAAGIAEVSFGFCILLFRHHAWPQLASAVATTGLLAFVAAYTPWYLLGAFNPVVMNVASIALSIIALLAASTERSSAVNELEGR